MGKTRLEAFSDGVLAATLTAVYGGVLLMAAIASSASPWPHRRRGLPACSTAWWP